MIKKSKIFQPYLSQAQDISQRNKFSCSAAKLFSCQAAFTLAEMMVVFVVIAIVISVTIISYKPSNKSTSMLYQRVFQALATAAYNLEEDSTNSNEAIDMTSAGNTTALCNLLAHQKTGYMSVSKISCSENTVSALANSFPENAVQFVTANGMKAYFSPVLTNTVVSGATTTNIKFRIIFFDLNGDTKPNSLTVSGNNLADIVGFILTSDGEVLPIGAQEYDIRYLSVRVHYPDTTTQSDIYSKSMSYYDAKWVAWNNVTNIDEIKSIDFYSALPASSKLKISAPAHSALDIINGCTANTATTASICEIEFNIY